jgi:hypothetical protein
MTPPPTNIDGTGITGATIDGQEVQEITIDGQAVFTAETIVDSFEDNIYSDVGNTLNTYYDGDVSQFFRDSSDPAEGQKHLGLDNAFNDTITSNFGNGLPNYPQRGDTVQWKLKIGGTSNKLGVGLFAQSSGDVINDGYSFAYGDRSDVHEINKITNGSLTQIAEDTGATVVFGEYLTCTVEDNNGTMTFTTQRSDGTVVAQVSVTDTTHTTRGIFYTDSPSGGDRSTLEFDAVKIL